MGWGKIMKCFPAQVLASQRQKDYPPTAPVRDDVRFAGGEVRFPFAKTLFIFIVV